MMISKAHEDFLAKEGTDIATVLRYAFMVQTLMVGTLKVKDDAPEYAGWELPVLGLYMVWGQDHIEYRVSLVGTPFAGNAKNVPWAIISSKNIEWINAENWKPA